MALIYRIDGGGLTYVGSTEDTLNRRLNKHRRTMRCWKNGTHHYITSFKVLEHEHEITLIEECTKETKKEREGYWIRTLDCVNKRIEGRTDTEYIKQYRQDNRDKINEKFECPCGGRYTHRNKLQHSRSKKHQAYLNQA